MLRRGPLLSAVLLVVIAATLAGQTSSRALAANAPVILSYKGDIWSWDTLSGSSVVPLTTWGSNLDMVLSPDGSRIAYASVATIFVDAEKAGRAAAHPVAIPTSIWVMTIAAPHNASRVGDQPPDATIYDAKGKPDHYVVRSGPSWNPAGRGLAWTELEVAPNSAGDYRLVSQSLDENPVGVQIPKLVQQVNYDSVVPEAVAWGQGIFAVRKLNFDASSGKVKTTTQFAFYDDKAGTLLSTSDKIADMAAFFWIMDGSKQYLAVEATTDGGFGKAVQWLLIDPTTALQTLMNGVPELYSLTGPAQGLSVRPASATSVADWTVSGPYTAGVSTISGIGDAFRALRRLAISPDGLQLAYTNDKNELGVTNGSGNGGGTVLPEGVSALVWGPTAWRVYHPGSVG